MSGARILTVSEAARFLGVHADTLRRYDAKDVLKPYLRRPNGARIYAMVQLEDFLEEMRKAGRRRAAEIRNPVRSAK